MMAKLVLILAIASIFFVSVAGMTCSQDACAPQKCENVKCETGQILEPAQCSCCLQCVTITPRGGKCLAVLEMAGASPTIRCADETSCIDGKCQ